MQLWKKNFLFTFIIFQLLIFSSVLFMVSSNFQQTLKQEMMTFKQLISTSEFLISEIDTESGLRVIQQLMGGKEGSDEGFFFNVAIDDKKRFNSIPLKLKLTDDREPNRYSLEKSEKKTYFIVLKEIPTTTGRAQVIFIRDLSVVYKNQRRNMLFMYGVGLIMTTLISSLIYLQMKRMYRPIQNISHELRTPLTLISGYSEMMLRMKMSEERKMEISSLIMKESKYLQETIEQLLLMGELKEGDVEKKSLLLSACFETYKEKYEGLSVTVREEEKINVNPTLIYRLLDNLLSNAYRENYTVQVSISGTGFEMRNPSKKLSKEMVRKINTGKKLSPHEYTNSGQGLSISREIVLLHEGQFEFISDENEVRVKIDFK